MHIIVCRQQPQTETVQASGRRSTHQWQAGLQLSHPPAGEQLQRAIETNTSNEFSRHATASPHNIYRSISNRSCFQGFPMSFELPLGISPFPSTPSEASAPLFSDQDGHEQFDHSQSTQSSRIVTFNYGSSDRIQKYLIISKIDGIFERMVDVLAEGGEELVIPYRRGRSQEKGVLRFPGSTVNEAIKFSEFISGQSVEGCILTIRPLQPE